MYCMYVYTYSFFLLPVIDGHKFTIASVLQLPSDLLHLNTFHRLYRRLVIYFKMFYTISSHSEYLINFSVDH